MITRLYFKNWRSLREVEITDLTPITVFIGANSSGKSNILDALRFLQYSSTVGNRGVVGAIRYKWGGSEKIRTIGAPEDEPTEIEFSVQLDPKLPQLTQKLAMRFYQGESPFLEYLDRLTYGKEAIEDIKMDLPLPGIVSRSFAVQEGDAYERNSAIKRFVETYIARRWQLFKELFTPQLTLPPGESDPGDLYIVEENGRNIVFILDFMRVQYPELYRKLEEDVFWLLNYVEKLETKHTERELSLILREKPHGGLEAPSISAGTARLIAMLVAFYALDMETDVVASRDGQHFDGWTIPVNQMPGLVVIEEPDTALNPGLLRNFVEQLRYFVTGEYPRQVILTTHNPTLLDYFEPEEVQVVTRNEKGDTEVKPVMKISPHLREIWLNEYGLGEVWRTNSFGGMP